MATTITRHMTASGPGRPSETPQPDTAQALADLINNIKSPPAESPDDLLTIDEVKDILSVKSRSTVYSKIIREMQVLPPPSHITGGKGCSRWRRGDVMNARDILARIRTTGR